MQPHPFDELPRTPENHGRLLAHAVVYHLLCYLRNAGPGSDGVLKETLRRNPFLGRTFDQLRPYLPDELGWADGLAWWRRRLLAWEDGDEGDLPLLALEPLGLDLERRLAVAAVGLVEDDPRFGTLYTELQAPLADRRPSVELVGRLLSEEPGAADAWTLCRPLVDAGLAEAAGRDGPRGEWTLRVPPLLWDAVRGQASSLELAGGRLEAAESLARIDDLVLPSDFAFDVARLPATLAAGEADAVVLRGLNGSDRRRVFGAVAAALGRGLLVIDGSASAKATPQVPWGTLATLTRSFPVFVFDAAPGETVEPPALRGYRGPFGVAMGLEGGLRGRAVERAVSLKLPLLGRAERHRLWRDAFGAEPSPDLDEISHRFHLPAGHVRRVARLARAQAGLARHSAVEIRDVREASRHLNRQLLDTLATRIETDAGWDHLVVAPSTQGRLRDLARRCRHREALLEHLGPAFTGGGERGVRALLTGKSGTGKTLAARIVACELEMDLYRVDLASVINKYVGETEKNLHQVLSRAEELDVVLLLDEGDSLLGTRTAVKSSNDRYANLETNYLLQRLENFHGIVLVTTNAEEQIDSAFKRRMDVVVEFLPPEAEERWLIWQLHLPEGHPADPAFLEDVALRCTMTGGQIRNAALEATLLALDGGGAVERRHVEQAVRGEYRKAGAACPLNDVPPPGLGYGGVEAFLDSLPA